MLSALLILAVFAGSAVAGPGDDAGEAYDRGDYRTALRLFRPLAEQGDALAQLFLGKMYDLGRGVPQNYSEALKWYRKAADQGDANAQSSLGDMYGDGHGVPRDDTRAARWYRLAADQGFAPAQLNLARHYFRGAGVPQDYVLAHMWCNLAAAQVPSSLGDADDATLRTWHDRAVNNRNAVAARMTPDQIAEAQRLAREWKRK